MKHFSSAYVVTALAALLPFSAYAEADLEYALGNDHMYIGQSVILNAASTDDIAAIGETVTISSEVGGDLYSIGESVRIVSTVQDDIRVLGSNITINSAINGDALVAGGIIRTEPDAVLIGESLIVGSTVHIQGTVLGQMTVMAENVTISADIRSDITIKAERITFEGQSTSDVTLVADTIRFGDQAFIAGNVRYYAPTSNLSTAGVVAGSTMRDESLKPKAKPAEPMNVLAPLFAFGLYSLLSASVFIALLVGLTKKFFKDAAATLIKKPWEQLLIGILYFVATPGATVLLLFTIIGIPLAILVAIIYGISIALSCIISSVVLARVVEKKWKKQWKFPSLFFVSLGMYIVLYALWLTPVVGWLLWMLIIAACYGALLNVKWAIVKKVR